MKLNLLTLLALVAVMQPLETPSEKEDLSHCMSAVYGCGKEIGLHREYPKSLAGCSGPKSCCGQELGYHLSPDGQSFLVFCRGKHLGEVRFSSQMGPLRSPRSGED